MQQWNNILNTAMLGTDKKMPEQADMPEALVEAFTQVNANENIDKEEKFLQSAALLYNYKNCGIQPVTKESLSLPAAAPETKPYCSKLSTQVLKDILTEESMPLLLLWLKHCQAAGRLIKPDVLPSVLQLAAENKKLQPYIPACAGNRGAWLSSFNQAWNFSGQQSAEEQWHTGTPEQRKAILKETRDTDPALASQWLQKSWPQEDAAGKLAFLGVLAETIGSDDIPFLESLAGEKSKKVKEEAVALLKRIPGSPIVQQYQQVLKESVMLKKEKVLLGLSSKTILQWQLPSAIDEAIFKTGVQKLSSSKEFTDDEFIIYQLMQSVPPSFWELQLDNSPDHIISLFQKDAAGTRMLPALVMAINTFRDKKWAFAMMQHADVFYLDIIPLLPLQQQEYYSNKFFEQHAENIIQYAVQRQEEWGYELAQKILAHTAKNIYQYPRTFYNQHVQLIPVKIASELEKFLPVDTYMQATWSNSSEYIAKLLQIKSQIIQSFNQ